MITFAPDNIIRIDYNITKQKDIFVLNNVGVHEPYEVIRKDENNITTDSNCIYVSNTNGNDNNNGTYNNPVKTISKAFTLISQEKPYIMIIDNYHYNEELEYNTALDYLIDIYKYGDDSPKISSIIYDIEINDTNCIFVSKQGSDTTGDGTQSNPYYTIYKANQQITSSKQYIVINDSETYIEQYLICNENLVGIYANKDCRPEVKMMPYFTQDNFEASKVLEKEVFSATSDDNSPTGIIPLKSGYFLIFWRNGNSPYKICWKVFDKNGTDLYGTQSVTNNNFISNKLYSTITNDYVYITTWSGSDKNEFYVLQLNHLGMYIKTYTYTSSAYSDSKPGRIGNYIYITKRDSVSRFLVIDDNGTVIQNWTPFIYAHGDADYSTNYDMRTNDGGAIHITRQNTDTIAIEKINNNYTTSAIDTIADIQANSYGACIKGTDLILIYTKNDGKLYYRIYNTNTLQLTTNETILINSGVATDTIYAGTSLDYYGNIIYSTSGSYVNARTGYGETYIINDKYELVKKIVYGQYMGGCYGVFNFINGVVMSMGFNYYDSPHKLNIATVENFRFNFIMNSNEVFKIKGINFNSDNLQGYNKFISHNPSSGGDLFISHCDFKNIKQVDENENYIANVINTTATNVVIKNTKFIDNDTCINIQNTSGTITIQNNIFAYNGINKGVYTIITDADNTTQVYNHNDFVYNYGTIQLSNNTGTVECKNSIMYMNANGINAESEITLYNSLCTDSLTNVNKDATVLSANPLYINLGIQDRDDINLNLKNKMIGYALDTPAYKLADDGTNAGSIKCIYIGEKYEYKTITLPKPYDIAINYKSINPTINVKTAYTTREGLYYDVYLKWNTLLNEDVEKIIDIYEAEKNRIKIYYNPVTNPDDFDTYTIVYDDDVNLSSVYSKMQDIGRINIILHCIKRA